MALIRIATFNVENLDAKAPGDPILANRLRLMQPQIERLRADVVCFQEVNGQEVGGGPRQLLALDELLDGTSLEGLASVTTRTASGEPYDERNLVVVSRLPVLTSRQVRNQYIEAPLYRRLTADPPDATAQPIDQERPVLHVELDAGRGRTLHVVNLHLKSRIPTGIPGGMVDRVTWRSADAWAEGSFLSSMKRMSQAVEVRRLVDEVLDADPDAWVVVAGDFNSAADEVPLQAIRGDVENTGNGALAERVLVPVEHTVPEPARYTLLHHGRGEMLDHILVTRNLLAHYRGTEIHNELLHDESTAFAVDAKFPESDHAPVVAAFDLP